jgi:hypothetical protein
MVKVKVKSALTKHHAMKAYWESGGIAPRILDLGTRWRWVVSFTPPSLHPQGNSPWYPLERRLSGPQSRSGRSDEKNSQLLPGLEPPTIQPIAQLYTTELSRLLPRCRWEDNIRMDLREIGWKVWMGCIWLRVQGKVLVNMVRGRDFFD